MNITKEDFQAIKDGKTVAHLEKCGYNRNAGDYGWVGDDNPFEDGEVFIHHTREKAGGGFEIYFTDWLVRHPVSGYIASLADAPTVDFIDGMYLTDFGWKTPVQFAELIQKDTWMKANFTSRPDGKIFRRLEGGITGNEPNEILVDTGDQGEYVEIAGRSAEWVYLGDGQWVTTLEQVRSLRNQGRAAEAKALTLGL